MTKKKKIKSKLFREYGNIDYEAAMLGSLGFSAKCIARMTKLSPGQAYYRIRLAGIKIRDYRNGVGPVAKQIIERNRSFAIDSVDDEIKKRLAK